MIKTGDWLRWTCRCGCNASAIGTARSLSNVRGRLTIRFFVDNPPQDRELGETFDIFLEEDAYEPTIKHIDPTDEEKLFYIQRLIKESA